jgi:hypothetical protein
MDQVSPQIDMFQDPVRYREGELPEAENVLVPYAPYPLRAAKIDDINSRSDLIRELTKQIPLNEFGLPTYYYRPDLLDYLMLVGSMERAEATFVDEMLQSAVVQVFYTQGFPTIGHYTPIWAQLDFETKEAHQAFLQYCDQAGVRQLSTMVSISQEQCEEWYHLNYWASRAKSLDLFKATHHARLREDRIMKLEDNHFIEGEKIFRKLTQAINNKTADELDKLDVDKLISSLERVTRIQRTAVGLSATGGREAEAPKATSVEVTMRKIASEDQLEQHVEGFDASLLSSPELALAAQELIIKVNK